MSDQTPEEQVDGGPPPEPTSLGGGDQPDPKVARSWRWRRRFVRVRRRVRQGFFGSLLLIVVVVVLVAQTGRGQDFALRTALDRVRSSLAGELSVEGVRSGTLLTGATLTGVRLVAEDGRPFVAADSVVIRYSLLSLIRGGSPIRSTVLWGVDLEISQYRDDQEMNLQGLVAEGAPQPDSVVAERVPRGPLRLGHVGIREGRARVLTPASPSTRTRIVSGPAGERLRELAFENLDLDVEDVVIAPGAEVEFEARLASFTSDIAILEDPLVIREVYGFASFGDEGLRVADAAFRLPETLMEGDLVFGPTGPNGGWSLGVDLASGGWGSLGDLAWIDPRIPAGRFRGSAALSVGDGIDIDMRDLEVELEASNVRFDGPVGFGEVMELRGVTVEASPLSLERLEPWIESELPLDGWLSGRATFRGTLDDLGTEGDVTLVPTGYGGEPLSAEFSGTIHRGANPGADDLELRLDPLNYTVLEAIWPNLPWDGDGSGTVRVDGRAGDGLSIFADLVHHTGDGDRPASEIGVDGEIRRGDGSVGWVSDLEIELRPLSLELFETIAPDLGLQGTATGRLHLDGRFSDLHVDGDLETEGGDVGFDARFDAGDPAAAYMLEASVASLRPAAVSTRIPDGTMWTGVVSLEGSGFTPDSAAVTGSLSVRDSRVGLMRLDSIDAKLTVRDGVLAADSLRANVAGVGVSARGSLGLVEGRSGTSQVEFESPSIIGLRPLLMGVGDSVMVRDGLSELDREFLRAQGIEPDTLPTEADVRLDGAVVGSASLSGYLQDLELALIVEVTDGRYQDNAVDSARVAFAATSLPALTGAWQLGASADGIVIGTRTFEQGGFEADMFDMSGDGRLEVQKDAGEQYRAVASFGLDSIGGFVDMTEASVEVDEQRWILTRPALVSWTDRQLSVDSVEVERQGPDPMHLFVDGDIQRGGESDFRVVIEGLHAEQVVEVAQLSDMDVEGHIEAELTVKGTAAAPVMDATFRVDGPRYNAMELTELTGSVEYRDRVASFDIEAKDGLRTVLRGFGDLPVDLGLVGVEARMVDAPMDVGIAADSLDAAIALSIVPALEDVEGSVTGSVTVRGTTQAPEPTGTLTLTNAAWSVEAIGVRHTQVSGDLQLRADRIVEVTLQSRGTGAADITGTVLLEPVSDPELELDFTFDRFLAVSRPDMEGRVSGGFRLSGSYTRPVIEGSVSVEEGTIFVDELQRSVGVVDLSDPFLFDLGLAVDTTALSAQPLIAGFENPFFDNLRVDVDLAVPRGSWLRSIETNAELSGNLLVRYDRFAGDFVLIGELQAVRGSHLVLGRSFQLVGGTVSFIGRPGLNPDLDIQASTRIRSPDNPPIDVNAQVGGTLVRPVVTLTSDQVGLAEEDLISYMLFGRPSGQLAQGAGQQSLIQSAAYQGLSAAANQLGTALAQEIPELGLDYLAVQQIGGSAETFDPSSARIEAGRYFGDDIFLIVVFSAGANEENPVPGIRVEWALTDDYNVEGFFEDRFLRSGSALLSSTSGLIENDKIWGIFLFREWGYSPGRDR